MLWYLVSYRPLVVYSRTIVGVFIFFSVYTYRYFDVDPSAALFHIEPHHNTSGYWSIWFTNNFYFSIELNEVFIARETKNIVKVSFISSLCNVLYLISRYGPLTYKIGSSKNSVFLELVGIS